MPSSGVALLQGFTSVPAAKEAQLVSWEPYADSSLFRVQPVPPRLVYIAFSAVTSAVEYVCTDGNCVTATTNNAIAVAALGRCRCHGICRLKKMLNTGICPGETRPDRDMPVVRACTVSAKLHFEARRGNFSIQLKFERATLLIAH